MSGEKSLKRARSCSDILDENSCSRRDIGAADDFADDTLTIYPFLPDCYRIDRKRIAFLLIFEWTYNIVINNNREVATLWINNLTRITQEINDFEVSDKVQIITILDVCFFLQIPDSYLVVQLLKILDSIGGLEEFLRTIFTSRPFTYNIEFFEYLETNMIFLEGPRYLICFLEAAKERRENFHFKWFGEDSSQMVHYCVRYGFTDSLKTLLSYGFLSSINRVLNIPREQETFQDLCVYNESLISWCQRTDVSHVSKKFAVFGNSFMKILGIPRDEDGDFWLEEVTDLCMLTLQDNISLVLSVIGVPFCRIPSDMEENFSDERVVFYQLMYENQGTCSLQNICKSVTRKRLEENWQLPQGIDEVPLPKRMRTSFNFED